MKFDRFTLSDEAALAVKMDDNKGLFIEQHGGLVSAVTFDKARRMTIDEFKQYVVPELKSSQAEGEYSSFIIRDLSQGRLCVIDHDGVTELHVTQIMDCPFDKLKDYIVRSESNTRANTVVKTSFINASVPVISYGEDDHYYCVVVKIPSQRILFKSELAFTIPIYMPQVLFGVRVVKESLYVNSQSVAVITQDSIDPAMIKLGRLALPNVFRNGRICVGNTRTTTANVKTLSGAIAATWDMFVNSNWNDHLTWQTECVYPKEAFEVTEVAPELKEAAKVYAANEDLQLHFKTLTLLKEKDAWQNITWDPFGADATTRLLKGSDL